MIEVVPMPNELAIAHQGRIAWINGCLNENDLIKLVKSAVIARGHNPAVMPRLHQLALISDMSASDYARQHSMLASFRVAAKAGDDEIHGVEASATFSKRLGMLPQRAGAYCCPQCIAEDLQHWGFSWYRRTHHLVGVDWCVVHGCTLSFVDDPKAFTRVPHIWLSENKLKPLTAAVEQLPEEGFLRRFTDIATTLLERERPFLPERINGALSRRATTLGLRISRTGKRPLISDHLSKQVAAPWLNAHLPSWNEKLPLAHFQRIDALATTKSLPSVGEAYAMTMAALYDTAEVAMHDVASADLPQKRTFPKNRRLSRDAKFWNGEVWMHYVECQGRINAIAEKLQLDRTHVGKVLAALGLPCLHDHDRSNKWAAFIRFCSGESISAACIAEQADQDQVEALLRKSSARVMSAMQKIKQGSHSRRKSSSNKLDVCVTPERYFRDVGDHVAEKSCATDGQRLPSESQIN